VIRFSHVTKVWPNGATALHDLSFHVPKGQFVFLTGHSGAGKSSVLSLISAHERPTEGEVKVANLSVRSLRQSEIPRLRRRLGIVFQDFRLLDDRTADENVAFALEVTGAPTSAIQGRVMRVLTQVAIARALVNDPPILLADEPTGNLDERATRSVFQLLRDINAGGTSVIMATHNLELVRQTTYRNLELKGGQLVYDSADEPAEDMAR
jgi:cell division transport system ATP-binding protein